MPSCAPREYIDAPFAAINGDDFYGRDAFQQIYDFLSQPHKPGEYAMTGFLLKNTLSENGLGFARRMPRFARGLS